MFRTRDLIIVVALAVSVGTSKAANETLDNQQRAALQANMQQHIDRNLVEGRFLYFAPGSAAVKSLHPVKAHPMIMRMGQYYVLCSDFRDDNGNPVSMDFYMARRGSGYVVFHTAVAQRDQLEQMMKDGKVKPAD